MIASLYQLSQKEALGYSLRGLCQLFKVNRAWYYVRQKLKAQQQTVQTELKTFVEQLLKDYAGYGTQRVPRRVTKALQKAGYKIGQKKVRRLLKEWGLSWQPLRKRKYRSIPIAKDS